MPNRTGDDVGFINIFNVHSVPQRFTLSYQCAPDYIWWLQWQHIVGYRQQQYRAVGTRGQGGTCPSSFWAVQLALSEVGGQIMPTKVGLAPPGFSDIWWLQWQHIVGYRQHQQWCFLGNFNQWLERPNRSAQWKILTIFFSKNDFFLCQLQVFVL